MSGRKEFLWRFPLILSLLLSARCSSTPPKGVFQPQLGETSSHIPGPLPDFGPFDTPADALLAACPVVLSMPNATAGRPSDPNFGLHWRLSTEYCAWVYYTPDKKFEMSMLATSFVQDNAKIRACNLPSHVRDPRYPDELLGHVFVVHNHPVGDELSRRDIRFIAKQSLIHEVAITAGGRKIPISIIAFFSLWSPGQPACDGFFQYTPLTGELLKWTPSERTGWESKRYGKVKWTGPSDFESFDIERE